MTNALYHTWSSTRTRPHQEVLAGRTTTKVYRVTTPGRLPFVRYPAFSVPDLEPGNAKSVRERPSLKALWDVNGRILSSLVVLTRTRRILTRCSALELQHVSEWWQRRLKKRRQTYRLYRVWHTRPVAIFRV
jgi:hypothetical protein